MKVVLDTNVVVSGLLSPNGPPASILNLVINSKIKLLYDNRILHEYVEVLHREKFGFDTASVDALISFFQSEGEFIAAEPSTIKFKDEDDRVFYEVMTSGQADHIITGNLAHFPKNQQIVSPSDFLKVLGKDD
jgi:uncharacterized protein